MGSKRTGENGGITMEPLINDDDEPRTPRELGWEPYHDPGELCEPCWSCFPEKIPTSFEEFLPDPNCALCGGFGVFFDDDEWGIPEWGIPGIFDSDYSEQDENE